MKGLELTLTLQEDCVFSERAATEGGHRGLDYIPGATLLGAAAARLYRDPEISPAEAFTLFHSGQVRFGNGLPLGENGERAWPVPLCWHQAKREGAENNGLLTHERVFRGAKLPHDKQPQQLRQGYVTHGGRLIRPLESLRLKTAIDPATGRARDAALFGYESLSAHQRFVARVDIDDAVPDQLYEKLRTIFGDEILLGRSRSAEFGRVHCAVRDLPDEPAGAGTTAVDSGLSLLPGDGYAQRITLWLLSDLAALDDLGQPTLAPTPKWLGLPDGTMVLDQSFVRARRYSPWNAHRRGPDLERQVLVQGSVLVFDLSAALTAEHRVCIAAGLGAYRETGLGQVWLDPTILGDPRGGQHPDFQKAKSTSDPNAAGPCEADSAPKQAPESELIAWLEKGLGRTKRRDEDAATARRLARDYAALLASARKLKGYQAGQEIGPSHSQWGNVLAEAKKSQADLW
ncbi:MAG TPA: hypothetical protein VES73_09880, partial [Lamprocystis sp. (in: g-proteobacteria)]|nr:hypothetical protein [Lamprocystis sp. (in: g-proteobacteria)]